jgi:penicillin-binding protein 2
LRGSAGEKAVLVNNLGYRQTETVITPVEPGANVVLTIDAAIQQAAEAALGGCGAGTRGAIVVMDVRTGDILAMASAPVFDPNDFVRGISREQWERLSNENLRPQINRCLQENYAPGSTFKTVVALAALESGLNPSESYRVQPNPENPDHGVIYVGRRAIKDTAPPGDYDFKKAFVHSSNSYFINAGLRAGIRNIVRIGQKFHLGERTGLTTRQEVAGYFPNLKRVGAGWSDGNTANTCIGQDPVLVTPLQMAVMTATVANGGKILWPRLVDRIEPQGLAGDRKPQGFPPGRVRDTLGVSPRSLDLLRAAMLADVEDADGTGRAARIPGFRVCGKTGTAQIMNERNEVKDRTTWFTAYAPYENPRYAVVVMVESGVSGGDTCAPLAREVFLALQKSEWPANRRPPLTLAGAQTR